MRVNVNAAREHEKAVGIHNFAGPSRQPGQIGVHDVDRSAPDRDVGPS